MLNAVPGGPDAGAALVGDPRLAKISFTGGAATAQRIAAAAASTLTPVVLELGGKSAAVVFDDADLDLAAATVVQTALGAGSAGRGACCRPDCSCTKPCHEVLESKVVALAGALRIGRPFDEGVQLGPVIDAANCERILGVIDATRTSGAGTLLTGGGRAGVTSPPGTSSQPTVFGDVDADSDLAQREVFGPVLALMRFTDEDHAVALANNTTYGLGAIVFTRDVSRAHRVAEPLRGRLRRRQQLPADAAQRAVRRRQAERVRPRGRPRGDRRVPAHEERVRRARFRERRRAARRRPRARGGRAVQRRPRRPAPRGPRRRRGEGRVAGRRRLPARHARPGGAAPEPGPPPGQPQQAQRRPRPAHRRGSRGVLAAARRHRRVRRRAARRGVRADGDRLRRPARRASRTSSTRTARVSVRWGRMRRSRPTAR